MRKGNYRNSERTVWNKQGEPGYIHKIHQQRNHDKLMSWKLEQFKEGYVLKIYLSKKHIKDPGVGTSLNQ